MKIAVYTSIFGGKDLLKENQFLSNDLDYICFTDREVSSKTWKVIAKKPTHSNPCRSAKAFKILPHKFLPEYDYSVWIDGNFIVKKHPKDLIEKYLNGFNFAAHDHNDPKISDRRNCIYSEAKACISLRKDAPDLINKHINQLVVDNYPANNGLISGGVLIRKHNEDDVVRNMNDWWKEIEWGSKRDQLTFNYIAWKNNFNFNYMIGNIRNNDYFEMTNTH